MSFAKNLLIMLIMVQLGFSAWTQALNISAVDQNGKPVEKAQVSVIYQKASQVSETDGVLSGETNAEGYFYAEISNRVQSASASKNIQVRLATPYWPGETRKLRANESASLQTRFTVPFRLEDVYVKALSSRQVPMKGANVVISGKVPIRKATGSDGKARFFFPPNYSFSGFVSYSNVSRMFSSREMGQADGRNTISVVLPPLEGESFGNVAGEGKNGISVEFLGLNKTPLPDHRVVFTFLSKNYTVYTDQDGVAGFFSDGTGTLGASIREYNFDYGYSLNFTAVNSTASVELYRLLKVASFYSLQGADNCFKLFANVTDPRPELPVRVRIFRYESSKNMTLLKVNTTASGLYSSDLCIMSDTPVRLSASNKYDVAEATLNLTFTRPKGPVAVKPFNETGLGGPEKPKDTDDMLAVVIVLAVACLLGAFFARAYLARSSRFMIEYLRQIHSNMEKRRHKPGIPPVRPLPPEEEEGPPAA